MLEPCCNHGQLGHSAKIQPCVSSSTQPVISRVRLLNQSSCLQSACSCLRFLRSNGCDTTAAIVMICLVDTSCRSAGILLWGMCCSNQVQVVVNLSSDYALNSGQHEKVKLTSLLEGRLGPCCFHWMKSAWRVTYGKALRSQPGPNAEFCLSPHASSSVKPHVSLWPFAQFPACHILSLHEMVGHWQALSSHLVRLFRSTVIRCDLRQLHRPFLSAALVPPNRYEYAWKRPPQHARCGN